MTYTIVGEDEADIRESRIAVTSPIARARTTPEGSMIQVSGT
ncbi:MAG: GreA/GreB family elongation factor [Ilumatobacteraceae bacterium]